MRIHLLLLLFANFAPVIRSLGALGDERWDSQFFAPGFGNGRINEVGARAMTVMPNGDLICAGEFSSVGGRAGTVNLARWNGAVWSSIGDGIPNGTLYAVAVMGNDIIVGGSFTSIQGQSITNLARWNGTNWSAIGGGVSGGPVRALAVQNGVLFAGGFFTNAGGNAVNHVASWDGTNWSSLGGGVQAVNPSSTTPPIQSLLVANGALYAGGRYFSAGAVAANNIARWNGSTWDSLGTGADNGVSGRVVALAGDSSGRIYLGGDFTRAGTNDAGFVAAWDGSSWSLLGGGVYRPSLGFVMALAVRDHDLLVGGNFIQAGTNSVSGLARWDGTNWFPVSTAVSETVRSLASHGSDWFVSGTLMTIMSSQVSGVVKVTSAGESFVIGSGVSGPNEPTVQTMGVANDRVQIGGYFAGQAPHLVAEWNHTNWAVFGDGLYAPFSGGFGVFELLAAQKTTFAAGKFYLAGNIIGTGAGRLGHGTWTNVGAGVRGDGLALVARGRELFVGHSRGVSRWTGSAWTELGAGLSGAVYALALVGNDLYAGGAFTNSDSTALRNVARWDGTNWSSPGSGVNGLVRTLAVARDNLFVGGEFTEAGGITCARVAAWNGAAWSPLGPGFSNGVFQLSFSTNDSITSVRDLTLAPDGTLFAGGNFTQSGTNILNFVAAWDGTNWSSLGSGVNHWVRGMACDGRNLFLGGDFIAAGTNASSRFARWQLSGDLLVIDASAPEVVSTGSNLTCTITVRNRGDQMVSGVEAFLSIPPDTAFVEATGGGTITNGVVRWLVGTLAPDESRVLTATVRVGAPIGVVVLRDFYATDGERTFRGASVHTTVEGGGGNPTVGVTEPASGSVFPILSSVRVTFTAGDGGNGVRQVDVYRDGAFVASLLSPPHSLVLSNLRAGTYQITGVASDYFDKTAATNTTFTVNRPANDNFTNAIHLSGRSASAEGLNHDATVEPGEPNHDGFWKYNSIWWNWTAPAAGQVTLDSRGSDFGHLLGLYRGSALTNIYALALAKNDPGPQGSLFTREVQAGSNYWIVVDGGYPFTEGHVRFQLNFDSAPTVAIGSPANGASFPGPTNIGTIINASDVEGPIREVQLWLDNFGVTTNYQPISANFQLPTIAGGAFALNAKATDAAGQERTATANINVALANDLFANRVRISGYRFLVFGTTVGAGSEPGEPVDAFPFDGARKSVWWEWVAPFSTNVTLSADSGENSCGVQVYAGTNIAQLVRMASDINDYGHNEVTFAAAAGTRYQVSVDGFHFASGTASGKYRLSGVVHGFDGIRTKIGPAEGPQLPLTIEGPVGLRFVLQASTNLSHWSVLTTNTLMGSSTNLQIPIGAMPHQFFRVVAQP